VITATPSLIDVFREILAEAVLRELREKAPAETSNRSVQLGGAVTSAEYERRSVDQRNAEALMLARK
jgi:hypothetical protein